MSKLDKDKVIADFTAAYEKANGKSPDIEAKGGWYSVDGGKNMRLAQLKEMGDNFGGADSAPAEKAKKTTPKKAAPKKAAAKKASGKGFSVKAFWSDQIKDENSGAILPR
ncbi:hypothetical protein [Alteromonas sp. H39]|uniref:hypothetical protein n=1 Tax=Alteromonas sp. H39 TaxID=3389876 RepID=UPI0039DF727A